MTTLASRNVTAGTHAFGPTDDVLFCDCTAGRVSLLLPQPEVGRILYAHKTDSTANAMLIDSRVALTNGATTALVVNQFGWVTLIASDTLWVAHGSVIGQTDIYKVNDGSKDRYYRLVLSWNSSQSNVKFSFVEVV